MQCKERCKIQQAAIGLPKYNNVLFQLVGVYSLSSNTFLDDIKVDLSARHAIYIFLKEFTWRQNQEA
jgi:hypothetical protein